MSSSGGYELKFAPAEHMVAILNEVASRSGLSEIAVKSSILNVELLRLDLRERYVKVEVTAGERDFEDAGELSYHVFRDSLIAGGLLKPKNVDDVAESLIDVASKSYSGGGLKIPPLLLAVDTNVLYLRVLSNWILEKLGRRDTAPPIIVSDTVVNEILHNADAGHGDGSPALKALRKRAQAYCSSQFVDEVLHAGLRTVEARKALLALHELKVLERLYGPRLLRVSAKGFGDERIVDSYNRFQRDYSLYHVVFMTCDDVARQRANLYGLPALYVDQSKTEVIDEVSYLKVQELLLSLAAHMLQFTLSSGHVSIDVRGIWKGKSTVDWEDGKIALRLNPIIHRNLSNTLRKLNGVSSIIKAAKCS